MGPLKTIHIFWLAGMSCDGCSISIAGATNPALDDLLAGTILPVPKVILHHPCCPLKPANTFCSRSRMPPTVVSAILSSSCRDRSRTNASRIARVEGSARWAPCRRPHG
jgi:hypothetical protein